MKIGKTGVILFIMLMFIPSILFASGRQESAAAVVSDDLRVVSLAPNITEIVFALGRGNLLVGRTDYCNYPPETAEIASVGSIQQPSVESILSLNPDIIIASTHGPKDAAAQLTDAGFEVRYYYSPASFEGVYDVIRSVGADLDAEAEADALVTDMAQRFQRVKEEASAVESRPGVYYAVGFGEGGDWTAGGDTFVGQLIELAGGRNIAADINGWSYSLEKLVEKQPEIILVGAGLKDAFTSAPFYSELDAVKNNRVYGINEDIISRQGPRLIEGIEQLNAIFIE